MAEPKNVNLSLIVAIGELILKYGVPAAMRMIKAWQVEEPTLEDIRELREMKPAADYFKKEA